MEERLRGYIREALTSFGATDVQFTLEHPTEFAHGDWATNAAMVAAKKVGKNPRVLAEEITTYVKGKSDSDIHSVEVAGPGFINFKLVDEVFVRAVNGVLRKSEEWGKNTTGVGKKVIVEYTDPNPFKQFHIGHLIPNVIGESIARLAQFSGADVKRANYQGDVGMHVAKGMWAVLQKKNEGVSDALLLQMFVNGTAYAAGDAAFRADATAKEAIVALNKKIYDRSDPVVNDLYDKGRAASLAYFETVYARLGTKFDYYFFESDTATKGREVVEAHVADGIFEKSDGAIIFPGEKHGLHSRVFINSEGLPTYEAKELGLAATKYEKFPYDRSVVVTGNEIADYFKVLLKAMECVFPDLAAKTTHIPHGMLRLTTGKMSSRTGNVIAGTELLDALEAELREKYADKEWTKEEDAVLSHVAVAGVKYAILRQAIGKDIIFDPEQSLSIEGDSGPYLQYTHARISSLLKKAEREGIVPSTQGPHTHIGNLEKLLARFPEVALHAEREYAPHHVATYLIELAREFNSYYGANIIVDRSPEAPYKIALASACRHTFKNGLWLLGIVAPERM